MKQPSAIRIVVREEDLQKYPALRSMFVMLASAVDKESGQLIFLSHDEEMRDLVLPLVRLQIPYLITYESDQS